MAGRRTQGRELLWVSSVLWAICVPGIGGTPKGDWHQASQCPHEFPYCPYHWPHFAQVLLRAEYTHVCMLAREGPAQRGAEHQHGRRTELQGGILRPLEKLQGQDNLRDE